MFPYCFCRSLLNFIGIVASTQYLISYHLQFISGRAMSPYYSERQDCVNSSQPPPLDVIRLINHLSSYTRFVVLLVERKHPACHSSCRATPPHLAPGRQFVDPIPQSCTPRASIAQSDRSIELDISSIVGVEWASYVNPFISTIAQ